MVSGGVYYPGYSQRGPEDNSFTADHIGHQRLVADASIAQHGVNGANNSNNPNPNPVISGHNNFINNPHAPCLSTSSDSAAYLFGENRGYSMSSYLPLRHTGTHGVPPAPRATVGGEDGVMHGMGGVMDGGGYMEHFLNIPEICPTGSYRNPRYYMGTYNAEACRMEALQQQHRNHHDLRMGLQGTRPAFYPNMNMGMRFADSMDTQVGANCIPPQNRADTLSPCTKAVGVASDAEPPSFYPWMSIVGEYIPFFVCL